ncbi:hypothetical protein [Chromobacterium sp. CV08]|uniref:hypothetical protein n=1 Tax=Chromobacterium sp. CV08 TaxID=3133274 RepID=UPI003DA9F3A9
MADHDKDPAAAARELRELDPSSLSLDSTPRYSWLLNHVLGELAGTWTDACQRQRQIASLPDASPTIHRNHAIAALYAGQPLEAWHAQARFMAASGASEAEAQAVIRLGVLQHSPDRASAGDSFLSVLRGALEQIRQWNGPNAVAAMLGAALNNIVSGWMNHAAEPSAPINDVMQEAAVRCQEMWQAGGTWVNVERACYLRALVANHLGRWAQARDAAAEGLKLIDTHGEEDVDRAFLLLELARAHGGLSQATQQQQARETAVTLAREFSEPGLREWFDSKLVGA